MFALDIKTAYFLTGFISLLMPALTWQVLKNDRSRPIALWCIGGFFIGFGSILISIRDTIPDWISFFIAQAFIASAILMRIQALKVELGKPLKTKWMVLAFILHLIIFEYIRSSLNNTLVRIQYSDMIYLMGFIYIIKQCYHLSKLPNSKSALWIGFVYALVALSFLKTLIGLSLGSMTPDIIVINSTSMSIPIIAMISTIIGNLAYINISLECNLYKEKTNLINAAKVNEEQLLNQIAQLNRQHSLGEMSAAFSHELTQPLTAILTNSEIIKLTLQDTPVNLKNIEHFVDRIEQNTLRANQIIEKIRQFIAPHTIKKTRLNANKIAKETAELIKSLAKTNKITLSFDLSKTSLIVLADHTQLSQVLFNLFRNAIEAMQNCAERTLYIQTGIENNHAFIKVRDTGPGISPENINNIGTQFFTTKANGLGLGLSISKSIIEQNDGQLLIGNHPLQGAEFTVVLPLDHR